MRLVAMAVLIAAAGLSAFSCATVPAQTEPLAPGEMRLLKIEVPPGDLYGNIVQVFDILFEADGHPAVRRACFYWSGDGPYCSSVKRVSYGSPGTIQVELRPNPPSTRAYGTYKLEGYVEYIRDGKPARTNVVDVYISVILK